MNVPVRDVTAFPPDSPPSPRKATALAGLCSNSPSCGPKRVAGSPAPAASMMQLWLDWAEQQGRKFVNLVAG